MTLQALPAQQPVGKSPKQQLSKEELLSRAVDVYSKIMDLGFQSEDAAHALQVHAMLWNIQNLNLNLCIMT